MKSEMRSGEGELRLKRFQSMRTLEKKSCHEVNGKRRAASQIKTKDLVVPGTSTSTWYGTS
jgi:hypothetical protein